MRTVHSTLGADDVHGHALGLLCRHVRPRDHGRKVTAGARLPP
jgi:hypothetical protein